MNITRFDLDTLETIVKHIADGSFEKWVESLSRVEYQNVHRVFILARAMDTEMREASILEVQKLAAEEADANIDVSVAREYLKKFQLNPT